ADTEKHVALGPLDAERLARGGVGLGAQEPDAAEHIGAGQRECRALKPALGDHVIVVDRLGDVDQPMVIQGDVSGRLGLAITGDRQRQTVDDVIILEVVFVCSDFDTGRGICNPIGDAGECPASVERHCRLLCQLVPCRRYVSSSVPYPNSSFACAAVISPRPIAPASPSRRPSSVFLNSASFIIRSFHSWVTFGLTSWVLNALPVCEGFSPGLPRAVNQSDQNSFHGTPPV